MNEHINYKDGYIVFEDSGTSPIAYGACEKWFATYDKAIEYAMSIDTEHCIMNFFDTETGENLGQVEDIKEVNMISGCQIDYARDKNGNILTRWVHEPTYEFTFNADKPIDTEEFYKILGVNIAKMPDAYTIQFEKFVQARKHKKRRINKKWLKRYGYKQIIVESKGWKMKTDTDGNVEFIKDGNTL